MLLGKQRQVILDPRLRGDDGEEQEDVQMPLPIGRGNEPTRSLRFWDSNRQARLHQSLPKGARVRTPAACPHRMAGPRMAGPRMPARGQRVPSQPIVTHDPHLMM